MPLTHYLNKERGQQRGERGTVGIYWNFNDLTKSCSPNLKKNVINQKLHHIAYLDCIICFDPKCID